MVRCTWRKLQDAGYYKYHGALHLLKSASCVPCLAGFKTLSGVEANHPAGFKAIHRRYPVFQNCGQWLKSSVLISAVG